MKNRLKNTLAALPFLFLFFLLAHLASPGGMIPDASADSHLSLDPRVQEARIKFQQREYTAALEILRGLPATDRTRPDVRFMIGLSAIEASRRLPPDQEKEKIALLDEAIAAFHAMLVRQPGLVRVRLELARAFFLKGEDDLSKGHFERVLAGNPPKAMVNNINIFLARIRARRRWSAYFGFSFAPDTNINTSSGDEIIYIYGLPFRRSGDVSERSGIGFIVWGGAEYQHPMTNRLRMRAGVNFSRREYSNDSFDQMTTSLYAGPRWWARRNTEMSLLLDLRQQRSAGAVYNHALGVRFEMEHLLSPRVRLSLRASQHERRYEGNNDLFDGSMNSYSLSGSWIVTPTVQIRSTVGYGQENPRSRTWNNKTRWGSLGTSVALPFGGLTVGGTAEFRETKYEGSWFPYTPDGSPREDELSFLTGSVFSRGLTFYGFSPQLVVVHETRRSNAQLYDYERTRAELRFVRQF